MIRVRTHTNPLKRFYLEPPVWSEVFENLQNKFAIDFGSAKGEFLLEHAIAFPDYNILGIEIRQQLVDYVREKIKKTNLKNAYIVLGNISAHIKDFVPVKNIDRVYIFFPDPWPKKRHFKRRLITSAFLTELAGLMNKGAGIFIRTDHQNLFDSIREAADSVTDLFIESFEPELPITSAWEKHCLRTDRKIYRMYLERL